MSNSDLLNHANNTLHWKNQAEYLNAAGKAVFEKSNLIYNKSKHSNNIEESFKLIGKPEMWMKFCGALLFGYAIENLIKGLIIKDMKVVVNKGKFQFPWKGNGHDLLSLSENLKTANLTLQDKEILKQLTKITTWGGRYPISKRLESPEQKLTSSFENSYDQLYKRLLTKMSE